MGLTDEERERRASCRRGGWLCGVSGVRGKDGPTR